MPVLITLLATVLLAAPGVQAQATPEAMVPAECEVTLPNGVDPDIVISPEYGPSVIPTESAWYGDAGLYARVSPDGVVEADLDPDRGGGWFTTTWVQDDRPDGMYQALEFAVAREGESTIDEPPEVQTPAFGIIGRVQTAGVRVPEGGCWEITATATHPTTFDQTRLTITVWVTIPALEPALV